MHRACDAFLRGFGTVVPPSWVNMFSPSELQLVLGGSDAPLDVDDWAAHTNYSGGYHADHPTIVWFWQARRSAASPLHLACISPASPLHLAPHLRCIWQVLRDFDASQRAAMLKFATSCSRAPLLGFKWVTPLFCIHKVTSAAPRPAPAPHLACTSPALAPPPHLPVTALCCPHQAHDEARLPTSATCMNLLKLPPYDSLESVREKLTYAIDAGCGFELS